MGYEKCDHGWDHYYVGCLGQTRVSLRIMSRWSVVSYSANLATRLTRDHQYIIVRGYQPNTNNGIGNSEC